MVFSEKHLGKKNASQKSWRVSSTEMYQPNPLLTDMPMKMTAQRRWARDEVGNELEGAAPVPLPSFAGFSVNIGRTCKVVHSISVTGNDGSYSGENGRGTVSGKAESDIRCCTSVPCGFSHRLLLHLLHETWMYAFRKLTPSPTEQSVTVWSWSCDSFLLALCTLGGLHVDSEVSLGLLPLDCTEVLHWQMSFSKTEMTYQVFQNCCPCICILITCIVFYYYIIWFRFWLINFTWNCMQAYETSHLAICRDQLCIKNIWSPAVRLKRERENSWL